MSRTVTTGARGRLVIRFSFDRRLVDLVKTLHGRRWHASERYWSVPQDGVVQTLEMLEPEGFHFDAEVIDLYIALGGSKVKNSPQSASSASLPGLFDDTEAESTTTTSGESTDWTVSGLNERVRQILQEAFSHPVWVVGEVSGFNKSAHKKHVGFQLLERHTDGSTSSQIAATLFDRTRRQIEQKLEAAGKPFELEDEIEVRMLARIELYVPWGSYRIIIEDLDVNYTLGEAARRREQILKQLTSEGLHELNLNLPLSEAPLNVGLITSLGSDAANDVKRTLEESGLAFNLTVHGARVQGRDTEPSVLNALDWFKERATQFDAILICRGGGSRIDLGWFDSEALGRAVALFPLPIIVGIGHEQDHCVLDAIARRAKTPTAAAQMLVERVSQSWQHRLDLRDQIIQLALASLQEETLQEVHRERRLVRSAKALLQSSKTEQHHRAQRLQVAATRLLDEQRKLGQQALRRLPRIALRLLDQHNLSLRSQAGRLHRSTRSALLQSRKHFDREAHRLPRMAHQILELKKERLAHRLQQLKALDPQRVLERGFSILKLEDGAILKDAGNAKSGTIVHADLHRGQLTLKTIPSNREKS